MPMMLLGVLLVGVNDPDLPAAKAAKEHLIAASESAIDDLQKAARKKIIARAHRAHLEVMAPYEKAGHRVDKIGLTVFFLLQAITDCDYMLIGADTPMQKGVDLMLAALEPAAEITPMLESAKKQARKVLDHLQRLGYYVDVPLAA